MKVEVGISGVNVESGPKPMLSHSHASTREQCKNATLLEYIRTITGHIYSTSRRDLDN